MENKAVSKQEQVVRALEVCPERSLRKTESGWLIRKRR